MVTGGRDREETERDGPRKGRERERVKEGRER